MWLTKSVRRTVLYTNTRVGWINTRNYCKLEDWQCAKVGLHVGGMAFETTSLSYTQNALGDGRRNSATLVDRLHGSAERTPHMMARAAYGLSAPCAPLSSFFRDVTNASIK